MKMITSRIQSFFDPTTFTATHVVWCPVTSACAVIDSVQDYDPKSGRTSSTSADRVIAYLRANHLKVHGHLETHAHADHLSAAPYLQEQADGRIAIGTQIRAVQGVFRKIFNAKDINTGGSEFDHL